MFQRNPPTKPYCGLTIVLGVPSRHDSEKLISGQAGASFEDMLFPIDRAACDIRLAYETAPLLPDTKFLLLLGEDALKTYKSDVTLNEQRGCPFTLPNTDITVIATFAPQDAFDRRDYENNEEETNTEETDGKGHQATRRVNWRFWLGHDTRKCVRLLKAVASTPTKPEPTIFGAMAEVVDRLNATRNSTIFLDIETDRQQMLTCLGIGFKTEVFYSSKECLEAAKKINSGIEHNGRTQIGSQNLGTEPSMVQTKDQVFVIPFRRYDKTFAYSIEDYSRFFQALAVSFANNEVVAHNSYFDLFVLAWRYGIPFPRKIYDTMIAHHRCWPELEKSLGHCISYYTDLPYHKNDGVFEPHNAAQEQALWNYNAKDVSSMMEIYAAQTTREIPKLNAAASVTQANASIRPYLMMTLKGLRVNQPKRVAFAEKFKSYETQWTRVLHAVTKTDLNPRSSQQVASYLYNKLALKCPNEDEPTNEKTLMQVATKNTVPSVNIIIRLRHARKAFSALAFNNWGPSGDRTTTAYSIAGTDTMRLGSKTLLRFKGNKKTGYGGNLQNWNKYNREIIIPDEGKELFQIDQKGAEAMIVAYLCRPGRYRQLFEYGIKPHTYLALHIFKDFWKAELEFPNWKIEDYLKSPISSLKNLPYWKDLNGIIASSGLRYDTGKMVCHASNYDMKAPTFQIQAMKKSEGKLLLSVADCKTLLFTYHDIFPEIRLWHEEIRRELDKTRFLRNLFGFGRRFLGFYGDTTYKQGFAFIPQSTVGCITHVAITEIQERLDSGESLLEGVDILQNGHDSILGQAPMGRAVEVVASLRKHLERQFSHKGYSFTMGTDAAIGLNWRPQREYKHPVTGEVIIENPEGLKEVK